MKVQNITDIEGFFKAIDGCKGKVELVTGEGDRLNYPSMYHSRPSFQMGRFRKWKSSHMKKKTSTG